MLGWMEGRGREGIKERLKRKGKRGKSGKKRGSRGIEYEN